MEETTLVLIKPHAVHLTHLILPMLLKPGLRMIGLKLEPRPTRHKVAEHYREHQGCDYFEWLCDQLDGHPVIAIAISGEDAVARVREVVGPTKPEDNPPDTIRGRFSDDYFYISREEKRAVRNVVHASSSIEEAERELKIWFNSAELIE